MVRLVLDTNVFLSGFLWEGNEAELIKRIERKEASNFITPEIVLEIERVLRRDKFKELLVKATMTADEIIQKILSLSHIVIGQTLKETIVKADPTDDKFIECALNSGARYIVSGDRHLLSIKEYKNIKIVTASHVLPLLS